MTRRILACVAAVLIAAAIAAHALRDETLAEQLGDGAFLALLAAVIVPPSKAENADIDGGDGSTHL